MNTGSRRHLGALAALMAAMVTLSAPSALANGMPHVYTYENNSVGTPAIDGTTATIDSVFASFDENNNEFVWRASFSADTVQDLPTGFTLVVNDGPMPKTRIGNLAAIYFEAEELFESGFTSGTPNLSAYAYNGGSSASAHRTSDFRDVQSPTPAAPDQILSSLSATKSFSSWNSVINLDESGARKTLTLEISFDATELNNHTPLQTPYDVMGDQPLTWTGIGFAETVGIWFHPFNNINPEYIEGGPEDGFLAHGIGGTDTVNEGWQVLRDNYGFFDVSDLNATTKDGKPIPEPASALLLLAGAAVLGKRRR